MAVIVGNKDIAIQHGVEVAVFLNSIVYWVRKNSEEGRNFHEGRYWTYSSTEELTKAHPYWTKDQIKRLVSKCKDKDLLHVGNFNKNKYDHTNWYSPTDAVLAIFGFGEITQSSEETDSTDESNTSSRESDNAEPYRETRDSKKTNNKKNTTPKKNWKPDLFEVFWNRYLEIGRGENKAGALKAWNKLKPDDNLISEMHQSLKTQATAKMWKNGYGIPYAATWINDRRWEDLPQQGVTTDSQGSGWAADEEVL